VRSIDTRSVTFLWEVLAEMTREERQLFLVFVWGRSRMPLGALQRFVVDTQHVAGDPDEQVQYLIYICICIYIYIYMYIMYIVYIYI